MCGTRSGDGDGVSDGGVPLPCLGCYWRLSSFPLRGIHTVWIKNTTTVPLTCLVFADSNPNPSKIVIAIKTPRFKFDSAEASGQKA
jgi:hypothetical protein